ncbi:MAG: hypothetical protein ACC645_09110, partial [Pirellulales bacterium]
MNSRRRHEPALWVVVVMVAVTGAADVLAVDDASHRPSAVIILADDKCDRHGEMAAEEAKN